MNYKLESINLYCRIIVSQILVIIIKTSGTGPSAENKIVYKFATPQVPAPRKIGRTLLKTATSPVALLLP